MARRLMRWGARDLRRPRRGDRGARCCRSGAWSAILVDHALGARACERLGARRAQHARAASCWSRRPTRHELRRCKRAGFTGYLVKPVRALRSPPRLRRSGRLRRPDEPPRAEHRGQAARRRGSRSWSPRTTRSTRCCRALLAGSAIARHRGQRRRRGRRLAAARAAGDAVRLVLMDVHMPGSTASTARGARSPAAGRRIRRRRLMTSR